jgi:hypothetical protein
MTSPPRHRWIAAAWLLAVIGCGGSGPSEPVPGETRPETALNIIQLAANAPPLFNTTVTFWAVRGQNARGELYFRNPDGSRAERYVRLDLSDRALLSYPDGRVFAPGDSVLITMRVTDPRQVLVEFEPSGLRFNPDEPAELEIRYGHANHDFNRDGREDAEDHRIEQILSIWRQESAAEPFVRLGTIRIAELKELDARLVGFSRLAIAY